MMFDKLSPNKNKAALELENWIPIVTSSSSSDFSELLTPNFQQELFQQFLDNTETPLSLSEVPKGYQEYTLFSGGSDLFTDPDLGLLEMNQPYGQQEDMNSDSMESGDDTRSSSGMESARGSGISSTGGKAVVYKRRLPGPIPALADEELSPDQRRRRDRRRERNKMAAARCRQKRLEQTNELLDETKKLETEASQLKSEIANLERTKQQLEFVLQSHQPLCLVGGGSQYGGNSSKQQRQQQYSVANNSNSTSSPSYRRSNETNAARPAQLGLPSSSQQLQQQQQQQQQLMCLDTPTMFGLDEFIGSDSIPVSSTVDVPTFYGIE